MSIIDRIMSLWSRKQQSTPQLTPRVVQMEPGEMTIEARGCRVVINETGTDKFGRERTQIRVIAASGEVYQLIAKPHDHVQTRYFSQIHVVKLKAPRKPKQAKPPEQEKEKASGGTQSIWAAAGDKGAS